MKYAVIGLGEFGKSTAIGLAQRGAEVIAVDINMNRVEAIKNEVALAVCMDGSHEQTMNMHGIGDVDVLVAAIGDNFEAQVLLVVHAKLKGIPKIVARATTPDHIRVLEAVGANEVFNPEKEAARWTIQRLLVSSITNYFEFAEGFSVVELEVPEGIIGKSIHDLDLRKKFRLNLVAIKRAESARDPKKNGLKTFDPVPDPAREFQEGDTLSIAGSILDIANFMGRFE